MHLARRAALAAGLGGFSVTLAGCTISMDRGVTEGEALAALQAARSRLGDPYVWGRQAPGGFDCSGLILWAYEQAVGVLRLRRPDGQVVSDATMHEIYSLHCARIPAAEARPGDILAIAADGNAVATHGGLIEQVGSNKVSFVNASSHYGRVVSDVWPLAGSKRGQRVIGFGRLLVVERMLFGVIRI